MALENMIVEITEYPKQASVYYKKASFNLSKPLTDCKVLVGDTSLRGNFTGAWFVKDEDLCLEVYLGANHGMRWVPDSMLEVRA